jgi:hypothetical protein
MFEYLQLGQESMTLKKVQRKKETKLTPGPQRAALLQSFFPHFFVLFSFFVP